MFLIFRLCITVYIIKYTYILYYFLNNPFRTISPNFNMNEINKITQITLSQQYKNIMNKDTTVP
ncbi:hypothetical protein SCO02_15310 [Staphylococcus ureilyticus]|uniref:Uncharacterized protein n=1 Tax=Staphylococcus ureilyticus TaxID=94138 RepID=A0AB34AI06_STAUR|nr:hypothetical protein [Staphylococcus ureilyticus]GEQ03090.1 hypothetical protein SCO02_15310 [Staphylococcus ureilyticus]